MCLGQLVYRKADPIDGVRCDHQRISYLHLKSVAPPPRQQVLSREIPFSQTVEMDIVCEFSKDVVDYPVFHNLLE